MTNSTILGHPKHGKNGRRGVFDTVEANLRAICSAKGLAVADSQVNVAAELRVTFTKECILPRSDTVAVLDQLKSRGLRLGLVSDCSAEVPAIWYGTPLATYFDAAVFSCVLGTKKPDPAMYRDAYSQIGIAPEKCLYIGDGFSRELEGAQRVGMHAVLIAVPDELSADSSHNEASSWTGDRVTCLSEVIAIATQLDSMV